MITGLTPGSTYYVRAYASNAKGTIYGEQVSFRALSTIPVLTTTSLSSITHNSAVCGGNITFDGGSSIIDKGVVWSTSHNPTISLSTKTHDGSGAGIYSSKIMGLSPVTTYFIRAYATNEIGTAYGEELTFITDTALPQVQTSEITNITPYSVVAGGCVTFNGGSEIIGEGVVWSESPSPTIDLETKMSVNGTAADFSTLICNLMPGTAYYVRAYATNSHGTGYGDDVMFTTDIDYPSLTTKDVFSIAVSTAKSGGDILSDGGSPILSKGVVWGKSELPTISLETKTNDGSGNGSFNSSLTALDAGETYYVRAYATNMKGTSYGNQVTVDMSSIQVNPDSESIGYTGGDMSFTYSIVHPKSGAVLTATSSQTWISNVVVSGNKVSFSVDENNSGGYREGIINLKYGSYATKQYRIQQTWSVVSISLDRESNEIDYSGGQPSFKYTIINPHSGTDLSATSNVSWIKDISISEDEVRFSVMENNDGFERTGKITLSYGKYASRIFSVKQLWEAPEIVVSSVNVDAAGGQVSTEYSIKNQRAAYNDIRASSSYSWISNVNVSSGSISFSVSPNSSGKSRMGSISLVYGDINSKLYASTNLYVNQSGLPIQSLTLRDEIVNVTHPDIIDLYFTVIPSDAEIKWSSSNTSVVKVVEIYEKRVALQTIGAGTAIVTVSSKDETISAQCTVIVDKGINELSATESQLNIKPGYSHTMTVMTKSSLKATSTNPSVVQAFVYDKNGSEKSLVIRSGAEGHCTIKLESPETDSYYSAPTIYIDVAVGRAPENLAVDLGLSVNWSPCNVSSKYYQSNGGTYAEEYGDYFAWGETEVKQSYDWSNYLWCNGTAKSLTKYNIDSQYGTVDNRTTLESQDDAATVKFDSRWRTPTKAEWEELINNCTIEWTTQNGINGYLVTSNIPGYTNNHIFLPASNKTTSHKSLYYHSSSLSESSPTGSFIFQGGYNASPNVSSSIRAYECPIRPVCDK